MDEKIKELKSYKYAKRDLTYWAIAVVFGIIVLIGAAWILALKSEADHEFRLMDDIHYDCVNGRSDTVRLNSQEECTRAAMYATSSHVLLKYIRWAVWNTGDWLDTFFIFQPRTWIYTAFGGMLWLATKLLGISVTSIATRAVFRAVGWN